MKVLTFNAWHGLDGKGILFHGELETAAGRAARLQSQVRKLVECAPDLICLQELNPLTERVLELASALSMRAVSQNDLCGIKLFGKGIPANLNSGLAILARHKLRKLKGLRLSGSRFSFAWSKFSFQLSETRYALIAEVETEMMGRLLVVNAHLHHGLEPNPSLLQNLQGLVEEQVIAARQCEEIVDAMNAAKHRRQEEGHRLLEAIDKLAPSHDGVILAGDMNADPDSDVIELIKRRNFIDIVPPTMNTWDKVANSHIFQLSDSFAPTVPDFGVARLREVVKAHESRATRLDYIFMDRRLSERVQSVSLFGKATAPEQNISDHFGICASVN